jgi:hypothetical protein
MCVAAADYDNDGYVDLYVTGYGENRFITTMATAILTLRKSLAWPPVAGPPVLPGWTTTATGGSISWRVPHQTSCRQPYGG